MLWKCDQQDILFENCQNVTFRIPKRELFDKIKIHGRVYKVLSPWFTESEISAKAYSKWRLREELPKRDQWCQKRTRRRTGATLRRSGKWGVRLLQIIGAGGGPCPPRSPAYYSFFTGPRFLVACVRACVCWRRASHCSCRESPPGREQRVIKELQSRVSNYFEKKFTRHTQIG